MARKYVSLPVRPRSSWDDDVPLLPGLTVYEPEPEPRPTGVLDARGNMLHELPTDMSVGFVKLKG